jgi:Fanconi anemia group M protein
LGLTASPGNEIGKIKTICKNLAIQEVEIRTRESPDVKEYLQKREFEKVQIDFPKEFEEMRQVLNKLFGEYVDEIKKRGLLYAPATKTNLIKLQKNLMDPKKHKELNELLGISACAVAIKLQHAIELLETQTLKGFNNYLKDLFEQAANKKSKGVIKLVKKTEFNFVYTKSSELLSKKLEHPKISELISLIYKEKKQNEKFKAIVFSQFRDTAQIISETMNTIDGIKSKMFIGQAKKKGFGLSQKDQKQIIIEFINGEINLLSATCIAEEGLDIPEVDAVIFYEPIPSAIRSIQRAGRTARLNKGKIIILITKNTRDESYYYVSRAREKQMNSAIETIRQDMKNKEKQKTL